MYSWIRRLLPKSTVESVQSRESPQDRAAKGRVANPSSSSRSRASSSPSSSTTASPPSVLSSPARWRRSYDLCLCHSPEDLEEAVNLTAALEASPRHLRCFLWQRDAAPGGAIPTEMCEAVQNSHCVALLITPHFLGDMWCRYAMNQALVEGPMSNRIIPLKQNLAFSQCPQELKFYYYIDLSRNATQGYMQIYKTVLNYLKKVVEADNADVNADVNTDSSTNVSAGSGYSKQKTCTSDMDDYEGTPALRENLNSCSHEAVENQKSENSQVK